MSLVLNFALCLIENGWMELAMANPIHGNDDNATFVRSFVRLFVCRAQETVPFILKEVHSHVRYSFTSKGGYDVTLTWLGHVYLFAETWWLHGCQ